MIDELIPVVLRFAGVGAGVNINFTFTTGGAAWSLGAHSGDSLGFSYNVLDDNGAQASCIRKIEFNNSVLSIATAGTAPSSNAFTLTLFLRVAPGVDYVQGYCTINDEASVLASFGAQLPVLWRNGRISAVLREAGGQYRRVVFAVQGARPSRRIVLSVSTKKGLGEVNFCLGPRFSDAAGMDLAAAGGPLPLASILYGAGIIVLQTATGDGGSGGGSGGSDFSLQGYLTWIAPPPAELAYVYLQAECDTEVSVYAQIGIRQPQIVSQALTLFTL